MKINRTYVDRSQILPHKFLLGDCTLSKGRLLFVHIRFLGNLSIFTYYCVGFE